MEPKRIKGVQPYESPADRHRASKGSVMPYPWHPDDPAPPAIRAIWIWDDQTSREELYLVNDSSEVLHSVAVGSACSETTERGVVTAVGPDLRYEIVQPGEAVLLDAMSEFEDGVVFTELSIDSPRFGVLRIRLTRRASSGNPEKVLLWQNGQYGKNVSIWPEPPRA